MKKLYTYLLCAASLCASAQPDYFANNPTWNLRSVCMMLTFPGPGCQCQENYKYYTAGDSTIAGHTYKIIERTGSGSCSWMSPTYPTPPPECAVGAFSYTPYIASFLRQDGYRIYEYYDSKDSLLYDFDLEIGDTLVRSRLDDFEDLQVTAIDTIYLGTEPRRRFYYTNLSAGTPAGTYLIEGIGHDAGLFEPLYLPFECGFDQTCFTQNGHLYSFGAGPCLMDQETLSATKPGLGIYPNPGNGQLTISYTLNSITGAEIEIFNALGETVQVLKPDVTAHVMHTELKQEGIYLYRLRAGSTILAKGKLVVAK